MLRESLLLILLSFGQTQDPQELNEFFQRVWSPYCKGNSLMECPSGAAIELRSFLQSEYDKGASLADLELILEQRYGDQVQMEPPVTFRGQLAYSLPWIIFLLALVGLFLFWKRRTKPVVTEKSKPIQKPELSDELKRLEEEVSERL